MNFDPLFVCNPKVPCPTCKGDRDRKLRKNCKACSGCGYLPVNLNGLWAPSPAFLVCGGPSLKSLPVNKLSKRGIVSLGINQVSSVVPVSAWTFGDPVEKFHHGLHLDPKTITFAPLGKLRHNIHAKLPNGQFVKVGTESNEELCLRDCPSTFGFSRDSIFDPKTFLTTTYAHWGGVPFVVQNLKPTDSVCACCQSTELIKNPKIIDCNSCELIKNPKFIDCNSCKGHFILNKHNEFEYQHQKSYALTSMMLGFRLLHYLGCPRVYLIGVDMWMTDEQPYAFEQTKKARNGRYNDENSMLTQIRPVLEASGMKVYNCNPLSKCDAFEMVSFDDALNDCQGAVPDEPFDTAQWYEKSIAEAHIAQNPAPMKTSEIARLQKIPKEKA